MRQFHPTIMDYSLGGYIVGLWVNDFWMGVLSDSLEPEALAASFDSVLKLHEERLT